MSGGDGSAGSRDVGPRALERGGRHGASGRRRHDPHGRAAVSQEFVPAGRLADIYFAFDAHEIRAEDVRVLDENAAWLRATPNALVLIEGHADERGTSEYNLGLGDLRARAAMTYLMAHGVPAARMVAISYGKERPICTEHEETCWAQNRRAHFLVKLL